MRLLALALTLAASLCASAQHIDFDIDWSKAPGDAGPMDAMLKRYLNERAQRVIDERIGRFTEDVTSENIGSRQAEFRAFFTKQLGGFPERTPLNARITGDGVGQGFRYEKIIYESLPGVLVTAVLFLPETPGPYPGVLVHCGHSNNGKAPRPTSGPPSRLRTTASPRWFTIPSGRASATSS